ncbi:OsmC-like organic hydroperoxide resistance protein [Kaistia sp. 32K]|uniref:organic hydroperoxide resistance protein n=1 Tax=Kaistia sp. 32K TaxID=2795690 RepID=UPI0019164B8A|nr:organic hydroperoxide resistance protein [Kaistia sp. 32K]BCP53058.1 OsmC-like organic hydroperoxide resistance protein [Kaistia sp. 32K]
MTTLYSTAATSTGGGRDGRSTSADGRLDLQLSVPKPLGGNDGPGTNPEQLFAAGYSACFLSALRFVAGKEKVALPEGTTVTAEVGIGPRADGTGFSLDVALVVALPGFDKAAGEDLVAKAHVVCPYSEATRANLAVRLSVAV